MLVMPLLFALWPAGDLFDFESTETGALPAGWRQVNSDGGLGNNWAVLAHLEATSGTKIFAMMAALIGPSGSPKAIWQGRAFGDGELSVQLKPMGGLGSQRAGLVFRYRDDNNYYRVIADLLSGEVSAERIEAGRTFPLGTTPAGMFPPNPVGWTLCRVVFESSRITVYVNGRRCMETADSTEGWLGKVGLWAASGSFTFFDDFEIDILD
jgi:hypothetical protein